MDRTLRADGLHNARDLGGLPRLGGGETPAGVFFRSENVDHLTRQGWEQVHDAGIRTVVDLRQQVERDRDATPRPDWVHAVHVDHDGLENAGFWADFWENGLVGTAMYYLPHLAAMPERTVAAVSAVVSAPPGGVLMHCMGGRDRTGLMSLVLLTAAGVEPDAIVDDYLETVRVGDPRAATANRNEAEDQIAELCAQFGTSTEQAFRDAQTGLDLDRVLDDGGITSADREALQTWRGTLDRA
ncbi:tyrosine-protein phosphatase [Nocardioides guangzhouensis]|uniref:Tyrosine-protein phosphatase n=1 Tax=Nocardioides guangzhouensis TaxID=2497878 RepID=A0A4Q4ZLM1_9ACTN|nr:tyrosine-protein phosphatase [Nocardioides guangzhouensis]RYP88958.1 tyrosine-protein phosphatase [Nocardioides guangzhouensis]